MTTKGDTSGIQTTDRLTQLTDTFESRKPLLMTKWQENVTPLLTTNPQGGEYGLGYVICGSTVYAGLALANRVEEVALRNNQISESHSLPVSLKTQAGLALPNLLPHDIDVTALNPDTQNKLFTTTPFDTIKADVESFWEHMQGGMRVSMMEIEGQKIYTVHPLDNIIFRIVAHQIQNAGSADLFKIPQKTDQILYALQETWPPEVIQQRLNETLTALQKYQEKVYGSKGSGNLAESQFSPQTYLPIIQAQQKGIPLEIPTLTRYLNGLNN